MNNIVKAILFFVFLSANAASWAASADPVMLKGIRLDPRDPLKLSFIIEQNNKVSDEVFKDDTKRLVRYFLAALTIPEKDFWVNLSPREADRIVPDSLIMTDMGADLLREDYLLKQLAAGLTHPNTPSGKAYWALEKGGEKGGGYGVLAKVWIVPGKALVLQCGDEAVIKDSSLKVSSQDASLRVLLPAIEGDINQSHDFTHLRQIYNAVILAQWFKKRVHDTVYSRVYLNKNKVTGIKQDDVSVKEKVYRQYLEALQKGAYTYVKSSRYLRHKYTCGGADLTRTGETYNAQDVPVLDVESLVHDPATLDVRLSALSEDGAIGARIEQIEILLANSKLHGWQQKDIDELKRELERFYPSQETRQLLEVDSPSAMAECVIWLLRLEERSQALEDVDVRPKAVVNDSLVIAHYMHQLNHAFDDSGAMQVLALDAFAGKLRPDDCERVRKLRVEHKEIGEQFVMINQMLGNNFTFLKRPDGGKIVMAGMLMIIERWQRIIKIKEEMVALFKEYDTNVAADKAEILEFLGDINRFRMRAQDDLADLEKIVALEGPDKKVMFDVNNALQEIAEHNALALDRQGVIWREDLSGQGVIEADPDLLKYILDNFVSNSVYAIRARAKQESGEYRGEIVLTSYREGDMLKIVFADNGSGISQDKIEQIYARGFSTKGKEGTGMGLYIVKQSIERLGGNISVRSKTGEGTVFTLAIPVLKNSSTGGVDWRNRFVKEEGTASDYPLWNIDIDPATFRGFSFKVTSVHH